MSFSDDIVLLLALDPARSVAIGANVHLPGRCIGGWPVRRRAVDKEVGPSTRLDPHAKNIGRRHLDLNFPDVKSLQDHVPHGLRTHAPIVWRRLDRPRDAQSASWLG